jgi:hypothetical protein
MKENIVCSVFNAVIFRLLADIAVRRMYAESSMTHCRPDLNVTNVSTFDNPYLFPHDILHLSAHADMRYRVGFATPVSGW